MGAGIAPVITAEAEITDDDDGQPNPIMRWNTDFANINGSLVNIPNLDNGLKPDDRIEQISIFDGTTIAGTLATIRMEVGSVVVKQDQILRALTSELRKYGMDPASSVAIANAAHLVFDKNDARSMTPCRSASPARSSS